MSKQRQAARAAREAEAAQRAARAEAERQAATARRARRDRWRMFWNRVRLWQHGPGFARRRERYGVLATVVLLVLLVVFLVTRSVTALLGTALVCVVAAPVLAAFVLNDRNRP